MYYQPTYVSSIGPYGNIYTYTSPNITTMSSPLAPTALGNAIADVLSLPHSAITINTFSSLGYSGNGYVGSYNSPFTEATLTVFHQGTDRTTTNITNVFTTAVSALSFGYVYYGGSNLSPLSVALRKYGFPNANNVYNPYISSSTSSSYPMPSASPSTSRPTKSPASRVFTGAPSPLIPALKDARFDLPSLGSLTTCLLFVSFSIFFLIVIAS